MRSAGASETMCRSVGGAAILSGRGEEQFTKEQGRSGTSKSRQRLLKLGLQCRVHRPAGVGQGEGALQWQAAMPVHEPLQALTHKVGVQQAGCRLLQVMPRSGCLGAWAQPGERYQPA